MDAFFGELDELRTDYVGRNLTESEWAPAHLALLGSVDELLPVYRSVVSAERVAVAEKMRADLSGGMDGGIVLNLGEAALDAAILEKALADAIHGTF